MGNSKGRRRFLRWAGLSFLALFLCFWVFYVPLPSILLLRFRTPGSTAFIDARKKRLESEGKPPVIRRKPIPLAQVSPHLIRAVLTAEDVHFFEHRGIDWDAVEMAREYNRKAAARGKTRRLGASTITQQLAKNLYLSPERSMERKAREAAIALTMDFLLPKSRILEVYLSSIEWGESVYGCEAAAQFYFKLPAAALTPAQAARLAALIPSPVKLARDPARLQRRAEKIAKRAAREWPSLEILEDEDEHPEGEER